MSFNINEVDSYDLHPEDVEIDKWALPEGEQFTDLAALAHSPEQDSFDAIRDTFGMEDLDNWWEKE